MRRRRHDELDDEASEMIEDTADDPEVAVQKTERSALLQQCLKQLSIAHRQVVDLVYYHEQSIEEVRRNHRRAGEHGEDAGVLRPQAHRRTDGRARPRARVALRFAGPARTHCGSVRAAALLSTV